MPELSLSIVTPSFNQAQYIEQTIQSVLTQDYSNYEYVIIDGCSTDGVVDIIKRYEDHLTYWVSEPDNGMYEAINKGFAHTSGEIMGWINSDDMYTPWAFKVVNEIFTHFPKIDWITTCFPVSWGDHGEAITSFVPGYTRHGFFNGENLSAVGGFSNRFIQQESTFWRRSLWDKVGGYLDTSYSLAADFELWARFYRYADLYGVHSSIGGFRVHSAQQTATAMDVYINQGKRALRQHGGITNSPIGSLIRKFSVKYIPGRLGRFTMPSLGLLYPGKNCRYNLRERYWYIETVFI